MLFNSSQFLLFFPIAAAGLFLLPFQHRKLWLLACSIFFYMSWSVPFVLLILYTTAIDYFVARKIQQSAEPDTRRAWLTLSITTNLAALFFFKYFNFFMHSALSVGSLIGSPPNVPLLRVILPIGISFYTFEAISYTVDVYRRQYPAEESYARLLLFITFFPKLIAGPIERAWHLIPQFERETAFEFGRFSSGIRLMAWGYFKKLVVADRLAVYVGAVYDHPGSYNGAPVLLATYFFAFQIFCDFSAYSDIAIGSARLMGYDLLTNFRQPYSATSVVDFWRRWHISLSTWFRDYLYIPLGGNRVEKPRLYFNLFAVFLLSGIWHGANWTFAVWGALHGLFFVCSVATRGMQERLRNKLRPSRAVWHWLRVAVTFHLVVFAWIFFRAQSLPAAMVLLRSLLGWRGSFGMIPLNGPIFPLVASIAAILIVEAVHTIQRRKPMSLFLAELSTGQRWCLYYALIVAIVFFGAYSKPVQFIYFQF
jgi:alginate O-acetyltransferase complex protein AlgI